MDDCFPVAANVSSSSSSSSSSASASMQQSSDPRLEDLISSVLLEIEKEEGPKGWLEYIDYFGVGNIWAKAGEYVSWVTREYVISLTGEYLTWLTDPIHRAPNPIHNPKYQLALAAQRGTLRAWLASKNEYTEMEMDRFLKYLRAKYQESSPGQPYSDLEQKFIADAIQSIEALFKPEEEFSSVREHNTVFLTFLRNALKSDCYKDPKFQEIAQILQEICWGKFTSNIMTAYEKELIEHATGSSEQHFTSEHVAAIIREGNEKLKTCDSALRKASGDLAYQKLTNELDVFSDPLGTSNIPEIRSIHTVLLAIKDQLSKYDVIYMRHGTPTYAPGFSNLIARWTGNVRKLVGLNTPDSNDWNKAEIIPEYQAFLDAAKNKGSSVLYVNHQDMSQEDTAEYNRSRAIEKLQNVHPQTFHFLALPFDGPIWKKIGEGSVSEWKARVLAAVTNQTDGFRLPKDFQAGVEF
ncbi:MAG: hypothetical protein IT584_02005, partial [Chlamydiae bacterium]|nr:hypothetical protein [Chlamydiota bacterium]